MTILPTPPIIGEQQIDNHECVPCSMDAALALCGVAIDVQAIIDWLTSNGLDTSDGTRIEGAGAWCTATNTPATWDDGTVPMSTYIPAAIDAGHPVIGFHQCDGNANPVREGASDILHCRLFYGYDADYYYTMNPWPPALDPVPRAAMDAADVRVHLTINLPVTGARKRMDPNFAAHIILTFVFGHGYSAEQLGQCAGDVQARGELAALYKWAALATSGGEIDLVTRLAHLKMDGNSGAPDHSHPAAGATGAPIDHHHATPAGVTGPAE